MSFSNKLKFLSDENIPVKITELLIKEGFNVKKATLGSTDKEISKLAEEESRIILTFDKHFINKKFFPPKEHSGIIFIDLHPPIISTISSALLKIIKEIKQEEFKGKLFMISNIGLRIRS